MRKWLVFSYALALLGFLAIPARPMFFNPPMFMPKTAAVAYSGPGDVVAGANFWLGLRAYTNALANAGATTNPVMDVRGATTAGACTIFLKGTGTGGLDLTTAGAGGIGNQCLSGATTFCTVTNTSCTVSKLYDQTGSGFHQLQATAANQPPLSFNCIGSQPCLSPVGTSFMQTSGNGTAIQPFTVLGVYERKGNFTTYQNTVRCNGGATASLLFNNAANGVLAYAGNLTAIEAASDNVLHALSGVINGATSSIMVDGANTTGLNAGTGGICNLSPMNILSDSGLAQPLNGYWAEGGIWASTLTAGNQTSMCQNEQAYYVASNFGATC
jgi:hypothetical protein